MSTPSTQELRRAHSEPIQFPSYTPPYTPELSGRQDQSIQEIAIQCLANQPIAEATAIQRVVSFGTVNDNQEIRFVISPLVFSYEGALTLDEHKKLERLEAKMACFTQDYPITISDMRAKFSSVQ